MTYLVNPDFSEETKPIEPGTYTVRIAGHKYQQSRNTGTRYIAWQLEVCQGEHEGKKLSHNTMIEGKGAGLLRKFLNSARPGYDGEAFDADQYIGARLIVRVDFEEYNGQNYARVKDVSPDDGSTPHSNGSERQHTEDDIPF